jgi:hypothetical protein
MITVFGEGRGFRVVWLLEEMGLAYRLRPVDLPATDRRHSRRTRTTPPSPPTNSSCTSVKPASQHPFTSSSAPAISRPKPNGITGAPARRWTCSKVGWDW